MFPRPKSAKRSEPQLVIWDESFSSTGSSAGAAYYYYFYDWQISVQGSQCPGPQSAVTVTVDACLGVDENADFLSRMNILPNPNNGRFTFKLDMPGTADFQFKIVDLLGKTVHTEAHKAVTGMFSKDIDMAGVQAGVYFATLNVEGKTYVKKIVIE